MTRETVDFDIPVFAAMSLIVTAILDTSEYAPEARAFGELINEWERSHNVAKKNYYV